MQDLVRDFTIIIVTHNMQQAAQVSDRTAFFTANVDGKGHATGSWSSTTAPARSSPTPTTPAPRTTSPVASADATSWAVTA